MPLSPPDRPAEAELAAQGEDDLVPILKHEHVQADRRAEQSEREEEGRREIGHNLSPYLSTGPERGRNGI
jgi:hypothetical protein